MNDVLKSADKTGELDTGGDQSSQTKGSPGRSASGPERWWLSLISVMNSIGTAWVFVLLIIINLDIGGRAIFNHPIRGVPEIVSLSIVACVFLQIAHTLKVVAEHRGNILNIFHDRLGRSLPVQLSRVDLEVETRGANHIQELLQALNTSGYEVNAH